LPFTVTLTPSSDVGSRPPLKSVLLQIRPDPELVAWFTPLIISHPPDEIVGVNVAPSATLLIMGVSPFDESVIELAGSVIELKVLIRFRASA
jgi:hypothetical protein